MLLPASKRSFKVVPEEAIGGTKKMMRRKSTRLASKEEAKANGLPSKSTIQNDTIVGPASLVRKRSALVVQDSGQSNTLTSSKKKTKYVPSTGPGRSAVLVEPHDGDIVPRSNKGYREERVAEPHMTNALLQTPKGTHVVAANKMIPLQSGLSKNLFPMDVQSKITTENLLQKACEHLIRTDPKLQSLVEKHPCHMFSPEGLAEVVDPFKSLVSSICAQQVSGAAANSIRNKFISLYDECCRGDRDFPTPAEVACTDITTLRSAGLSQRKAEYIKGLAEKFVSGELSAKLLLDATDEELLEKLVAVRGLGRWSAEMFACFALKRADIFSVGDLGVQRGVAAYLGRDTTRLKNKGGKWKYASEKEMVEVSDKFAPYRSLFMWLMWRIEETDTQVLE